MSRKAKPAAGPDHVAAPARRPVVPASGKHDWMLGAILVLVVFIAYMPAWRGDFIWDDDTHLTDNVTLRSAQGLWDIWFQPGATCQYYPLSFSWWWLGYHVWGLNPLGFHLLNLALHGVVAVMLWQVLRRLNVRAAWLAGAIFALHPVNVMSVAWMTELKNSLSGTLVLGAAWAYLRFARLGVYAAAEPDRAAWRFGWLSLALFQLAMFAKTAVSFLPVTLLLVVWWQRGRMTRRCWWPVLAMFGIAVGMGLLTLHIEHIKGAAGNDFQMGFLERVLVSGRSFWFYLGKLFYPHPLTFIYERWQVDPGVWWQYTFPVAMLALLGGLWLLKPRTGKGLLAGLLHFYVTTSLLILVQVLYMMRYSFVTDHWQYFGAMSVVALAAAGIDRAFDRFGTGKPLLKPAFCGLLLLTLGTLTWQQSKTYANLETLWRSNIERNPSAWMAHNNLGNLLLRRGNVAEAITHFHAALQMKPDYPEAHSNLGYALFQTGDLDAAMAEYQQALQINPYYAEAHNNLGIALAQKGNLDEAIVHYQQALQLKPDFAEAQNSLGVALLKKGSVDEAIAHFAQALKIKPDYTEAQNNLGSALLQKGSVDEAIAQYQQVLQTKPSYAEANYNLGNALLKRGNVAEAIAHFQKALQSKPDYAKAHYTLGTTLLQLGKIEEAIGHYQQALQINPSYAEARNNLAWVLATAPQASQRNGSQAVALATQANQLASGQNPTVLRILAAAYAEAGQFRDAVQSAQMAIDLARASGQTNLMNLTSDELKFYAAGLPFHQ